MLMPAIPLLSLIGCSSGGPLLDGPWTLDSTTNASGETTSYPLVETYSGYDYTETSTASAYLSAWSDGLARFTDRYSRSYASEDPSNESYSYDDAYSSTGHWIREGGGEYTLFFDETSLDMKCTVDGESLDCELEFREGSLSFKRL